MSRIIINQIRTNHKFQVFIFTLIFFIVYSSIFGYEISAIDIDDNFDWMNMSPSIAPPVRFAAEITYDTESDRIVLFSGALTPYIVHNDTWIYDYNTNSWENVSPLAHPGGRGAFAMVYDEESDRSILFGGVRKYYDPPEPMVDWGDTWAYDSNTNTWENMTLESGPRSRSIHNMAYDSESDRIILYGGFWGDSSAAGGRRALSDTWAYDYNSNNWTEMNPISSPGLLYAFGMTYDTDSDRVILYGGKYKSNGYTRIEKETWAYDFNSNSWIKMNPPTSALRRGRFQMVYHVKWDRIILFGGDTEGIIYDDTWIYDYNSNSWIKLKTVNQPSKRYYSDLAYDNESNRIILFGGSDFSGNPLNETWVLAPTHDSTTAFPITTPLSTSSSTRITLSTSTTSTVSISGFELALLAIGCSVVLFLSRRRKT